MRDPSVGTATSLVTFRGPVTPTAKTILTADALRFLIDLNERFSPRVDELLEARSHRHAAWRFGERPRFRDDTRAVRESEWRVAPTPADLERRVVEITGPVDRKMIINGLNSGADVFMADFEDATSPTWRNVVAGQRNLRDAVLGTITFDDPGTGRHYALDSTHATLMVRPRGWHLTERHLLIDGKEIPAALFDFGLFFFHNAKTLVDTGRAPYFYLPKLECHREARLWNDVFVFAQGALGIPHGTVRATVLIETLPAAFEMDEILYELRDHSAGLNCGRWDYVFSFIKVHQSDPSALLPDRLQVTMEQPCMRAYTRLAVKTCHRRGAHAIGGMSAFIPIKNDDQANAAALAQVRSDKSREVDDGHDGTWVAHPALVDLAREVFESRMQGDNQLDVTHDDLVVDEATLLEVPTGTRTEAGVRHNVRVGIRYLESWLSGVGCVPIQHLMEDAATAEISRSQLWQWVKHGAMLADGQCLTPKLFEEIVNDEMRSLLREVGAARFADGHFAEARALFVRMAKERDLDEFMTLRAYPKLNGFWE